MITINIQRNFAEYTRDQIFNYINLWKNTQLQNVAHLQKSSGEYLTVRLINSLLQNVEYAFKRKLFLTAGKKVKISLNDAEGIALYKILLITPIDAKNIWAIAAINSLIEMIDQQILK